MANNGPIYETSHSGGMFSDYCDADYESQSSTKSREMRKDKERENERQRSKTKEREREIDREAERKSKNEARERDRDKDRERNKHERPHRYRGRDYTELRHSERSRGREKRHSERSRDREMGQSSLSRYRYEGRFRSPSKRYRGGDRNRRRRNRSSSERSASPYCCHKDRGRNHRYIEGRYRGGDKNRERRNRSSSDRSALTYCRHKDEGRNHRCIEAGYKGGDRNRERKYWSSSDRSDSPYCRHKDRGRNHSTSKILVSTIDRKKDEEREERERRNGKERDRERDSEGERKSNNEKERERDGDKDIERERHDSGIDHKSSGSENEYDFGLLRELIEIFSITVFTDRPCRLYGTIEADEEYIFKKTRFDEKAHYSSNLKKETSPFEGFPFSHEIANLAGPERAIEAYDKFTIELNLMSDDSPLSNNEVIKGRMCWDPFDDIKYNQRVRGVVDGKFGKAIINYAVFENAVEAHVEVSIFHGHKQLVVSAISALNSCIRDQKVVLYGQHQCEAIVPLQRIPLSLSRSTVVVPSNGTLTIEFQLAMFDECGHMTCGEEEVFFEAKRCGKIEKRIQKDYGEIGVTITWLSY